ncbi:hypothetical protein ACE1CI_10275 [Aerosakkonemataceae cyanobacterium BLCC-F50]|uniref:Uncharacterized protein n=1 Tax=Floridaenema flaviceps BLCC-F50 TaxID=3153642 RepID=A0ABV4XNJ9_9CYAN
MLLLILSRFNDYLIEMRSLFCSQPKCQGGQNSMAIDSKTVTLPITLPLQES